MKSATAAPEEGGGFFGSLALFLLFASLFLTQVEQNNSASSTQKTSRGSLRWFMLSHPLQQHPEQRTAAACSSHNNSNNKGDRF